MTDQQKEYAVSFIKKAYDGLLRETGVGFSDYKFGAAYVGSEAISPLVEEFRGRLSIGRMALLTFSAYYAVKNGMKLFSDEVSPESNAGAEMAGIAEVFLIELAAYFDEYDPDCDWPDTIRTTDHEPIDYGDLPAYPPAAPLTPEQTALAEREEKNKSEAHSAITEMWRR